MPPRRRGGGSRPRRTRLERGIAQYLETGGFHPEREQPRRLPPTRVTVNPKTGAPAAEVGGRAPSPGRTPTSDGGYELGSAPQVSAPPRHHTVVGDILGALDDLAAPILQPGRTVAQTARAAANLGVEPRSTETPASANGQTAQRVLPEAIGRALEHLVAAGTQAPKIAAPKPSGKAPRPVDVALQASAGAPKGPDPLGAKTLGNVTAQRLAEAAKEGALRISKGGVVSTPENRNARRQLVRAYEHLDATNGLRGPLTPGQIEFAEALSRATGGILKPRTVATQALQEESGAAAQKREAEHNFDALNIGYTDAGPLPLTRDPVWSNPVTAAKATAEFFEGKRFSPSPQIASILEQAKGKSVPEQLRIIGESGWATSAYASDLAQTAKLVSEIHDPQAAIQLQAAKKNARAHGINPTPFNGDVAGGDREYVYIRADGKGAVDWAESALGTQQGTARQLHWAAITHGPEDPWCAEFVGAAMLRQGLSIPADAPYAGSFLNWKDGTNLGTDLNKVKPGDLLVFGVPGGRAQHIGIYKGDGVMISGNFSDEVAESSVAQEVEGTGLQGIVRPKYKGGRLKVRAGSLPGSSLATVPGSTAGGVGATGEESVAGAVTGGQPGLGEGRPVSIGEVPVDEILSPEHRILQPEEEGAIQRIINARRTR